jgi:hypothetical protein
MSKCFVCGQPGIDPFYSTVHTFVKDVSAYQSQEDAEFTGAVYNPDCKSTCLQKREVTEQIHLCSSNCLSAFRFGWTYDLAKHHPMHIRVSIGCRLKEREDSWSQRVCPFGYIHLEDEKCPRTGMIGH